MPRGQYDRSKAKPRRRRSTSTSLSARLNKLTKELAVLAEDVRKAEGVQEATEDYVAKISSLHPPAGVAAPKKRRRRRVAAAKTRRTAPRKKAAQKKKGT
jgi:hypothetical protein